MKSTFIEKLYKNKTLLLMLLPAIVFFLVFCYVPMIGVIIAFKSFDYNAGVFGSPWVGLENFKFLFLSGKIFAVTRNTVLYNLAFIVINNVLEISLAIMMAELTGKWFKRITQSLTFLPYFLSWVVVGAIVYNMFNYESGLLNGILKSLNMDLVNLNNYPVAWIFIIIFFNLWKNIGYGSVIYLAAVTGIDTQMYEAAEMDGANIFNRIRHITIPSLTPTIIILVLLSIGQIFRGDFSMFYQIVGGNSLVYNTTDVIDTFVTRSLLESREFGMSAAAGLFQSVLCFLIISIVNHVVRKIDKDYALF